MVINKKKRLYLWAVIFLFVARFTSFYDEYNENCNYAVIADQTISSSTDLVNQTQNTDDIFPGNKIYTAIFYSHLDQSEMVHQDTHLKSSFWRYFALICIIACCLILVNQLQFFRNAFVFLWVLPYFLLQLQIIHKFDGKYRCFQ